MNNEISGDHQHLTNAQAAGEAPVLRGLLSSMNTAVSPARGFQPPDLRIESAYAEALRTKQDLMLVHFDGCADDQRGAPVYILTAERGVIPVPPEQASEMLSSLTAQRHSTRYYRTDLTRVSALPVAPDVLFGFIDDVHRFAKLALFNPYLKDHREEFGFVARRVENGTLITGRGSSKSAATIEDLSLVTEVDPNNLILSVSSLGKKASLNASLAQLILEARPEVEYIVHAHISLPEAAVAERVTSPASAEDWEAIEPLVRAGHAVIEQPHHGVLILLKNAADLFTVLERNSVYRMHADHYDLAYHRFLGNSRLTDIFRTEVALDAKILDVAAGTAEVSRLLIERGYSELTLTDISPAMLAVARDKLKYLLPADRFIEAPMQHLPFDGEFDAAIVRQAINYLPPSELVAGLASIRGSLTPGGKLFFNSFDPTVADQASNRFVRQELQDKIFVTQEGNLREGQKLYHGQRTEMWNSLSGDYRLIYDLNGFWIYTATEFEDAARKAGFSNVRTLREGSSLYFICEA